MQHDAKSKLCQTSGLTNVFTAYLKSKEIESFYVSNESSRSALVQHETHHLECIVLDSEKLLSQRFSSFSNTPLFHSESLQACVNAGLFLSDCSFFFLFNASSFSYFTDSLSLNETCVRERHARMCTSTSVFGCLEQGYASLAAFFINAFK